MCERDLCVLEREVRDEWEACSACSKNPESVKRCVPNPK